MDWQALESELYDRASRNALDEWASYYNYVSSIHQRLRGGADEGLESIQDAQASIYRVSTHFLSHDFQIKFWQAVSTLDNCVSTILVDYLQAALRIYRLVSNILSGTKTDWISYDFFLKRLLMSIFQSLSLFIFSQKATILANLLCSLDNLLLQRWVLIMLSDLVTSKLLIGIMDGHWAVKSMSLLFKTIKSPQHINPAHHELVQLLTQHAVQSAELDILLLLEKAISLHPISSSFAVIMLGCIPMEQQLVLLEALVGLLGDKTTLSSGDICRQLCYTEFILYILHHTSAISITSPSSSQGLPLEVLLTVCVSTLFDCSEQTTRLCGMRIARAYTSIVGRALEFEELIVYEQQQHAQAAQPAVVSSSSTLLKAAPTPVGGDDSDSDIDIEALTISPEPRYGADSLKIPELNTRFLRGCLECKSALRCLLGQ
jgi:hypothetical protein